MEEQAIGLPEELSRRSSKKFSAFFEQSDKEIPIAADYSNSCKSVKKDLRMGTRKIEIMEDYLLMGLTPKLICQSL